LLGTSGPALMGVPDLKMLAFFLDGLRYSLRMGAVAARRLPKTLETVAHACRSGTHDENQVVSALLDAWTMIDMCHRLRELVQQTPGLPQKTPAVQLFLRKTASIGDLRNHVQHFRSGIGHNHNPTAPLWGTLAWVPECDPITCYSIFTGNYVDGLQVHSISYDTNNFCFTSTIELRTEVATVDLPSIWTATESLEDELRRWAEAHPMIQTDQRPVSLVWRISFERREDGQILVTKHHNEF
jgi:hypothetical protein